MSERRRRKDSEDGDVFDAKLENDLSSCEEDGKESPDQREGFQDSNSGPEGPAVDQDNAAQSFTTEEVTASEGEEQTADSSAAHSAEDLNAQFTTPTAEPHKIQDAIVSNGKEEIEASKEADDANAIEKKPEVPVLEPSDSWEDTNEPNGFGDEEPVPVIDDMAHQGRYFHHDDTPFEEIDPQHRKDTWAMFSRNDVLETLNSGGLNRQEFVKVDTEVSSTSEDRKEKGLWDFDDKMEKWGHDNFEALERGEAPLPPSSNWGRNSSSGQNGRNRQRGGTRGRRGGPWNRNYNQDNEYPEYPQARNHQQNYHTTNRSSDYGDDYSQGDRGYTSARHNDGRTNEMSGNRFENPNDDGERRPARYSKM